MKVDIESQVNPSWIGELFDQGKEALAFFLSSHFDLSVCAWLSSNNALPLVQERLTSYMQFGRAR